MFTITIAFMLLVCTLIITVLIEKYSKLKRGDRLIIAGMAFCLFILAQCMSFFLLGGTEFYSDMLLIILGVTLIEMFIKRPVKANLDWGFVILSSALMIIGSAVGKLLGPIWVFQLAMFSLIASAFMLKQLKKGASKPLVLVVVVIWLAVGQFNYWRWENAVGKNIQPVIPSENTVSV